VGRQLSLIVFLKKEKRSGCIFSGSIMAQRGEKMRPCERGRGNGEGTRLTAARKGVMVQVEKQSL